MNGPENSPEKPDSYGGQDVEQLGLFVVGDGGHDTPEAPPDAPDETILGNLPVHNPTEEEKAESRQLGGSQKVGYLPNGMGRQKQGLEFKRDGQLVPLDQLKVESQSGEVRHIGHTIISGSKPGGNDEYYEAHVIGNKVYEVVRGGDNPRITVHEMPADQGLPTLMIGQDMGGFKLDKVEISQGNQEFHPSWREPATTPDKQKMEQMTGRRQGKPLGMRGEDPFTRSMQMVADIDATGAAEPREIMDNTGRLNSYGPQVLERHPKGLKELTGAYSRFDENGNEVIPPWERADRLRQDIPESAIPGRLEHYTRLLGDPTYVPSPKNFREMRQLIDRLTIGDTGDRQGALRLSANGQRLDQAMLDTLRDRSELGPWRLSDFQMGIYKKGMQNQPLDMIKGKNKSGYFLTGQLGGIMTVPDFFSASRRRHYRENEARIARGEPPVQEPNQLALAKQYRDYVNRRIALGNTIKEIDEEQTFERKIIYKSEPDADQPTEEMPTVEMKEGIYDWQNEPDLAAEWGAPGPERELEVPAFVTANDVAFRALADYRKWQAEHTIGAQAKRALNTGLERVHRGNMRVDSAVRRKMDQAVDKAGKGLDRAHRASMRVDTAVRNKMDAAVEGADRGLDKVHRGNMRVDAAVRTGMDRTVEKAGAAADRVHRANMKVDAAAQKGLDKTAEQAARAKAYAEDYRNMWNESAVRPPSRMSEETVARQALKDYVRWQAREKQRNRPGAVAAKTAKKAARKLRRPSA